MSGLLSNWRALKLNSCLKLVQCALPEACLLCAGPAVGRSLCRACYASLPWLTADRCPQCALPVHGASICGACRRDPPRYARASAAFAYSWPLAALIQQYKYAGNLALATLLAGALLERLEERADLIIPMPLTLARLRSRGFNQALELARVVSRRTGIALAPHACRRVRDGTPQALLPWSERARNVRGAFVCDADLSDKRVAVIDDVMTTGATLNELARNLLRAGALEVCGWTIARTLPS